MTKDHDVRHVQQNAGIEHSEQAGQYTQYGIDILNEQYNNILHASQSIIDRFLAVGESDKQTGSSDCGIGDMLGI